MRGERLEHHHPWTHCMADRNPYFPNTINTNGPTQWYSMRSKHHSGMCCARKQDLDCGKTSSKDLYRLINTFLPVTIYHHSGINTPSIHIKYINSLTS